MKYCVKCGNEMVDDAVICLKCGCMINQETQLQNNAIIQKKQNNFNPQSKIKNNEINLEVMPLILGIIGLISSSIFWMSSFEYTKFISIMNSICTYTGCLFIGLFAIIESIKIISSKKSTYAILGLIFGIVSLLSNVINCVYDVLKYWY